LANLYQVSEAKLVANVLDLMRALSPGADACMSGQIRPPSEYKHGDDAGW